ncbi:MAG: glycosyl hydrolase family 17 protein [Methylococcales bacterium]|nr:glycosyl hydrolase family 17 protein [Methylococcales bacterium]
MFSKRGLVAIVLTACAVISVLYWQSMSRPVTVADALTDHLSCVSYSPFHKADQTPFNRASAISAAQIEVDLTELAGRFDCVRTYTVTQGMEAVPGIAEKLGIKALLGIWIGRERDENEKELAAGIALGQKYPATIRAIVVGNEVLLRREQPPAMMRDYIQRVKAAVSVPVTYADVWEFWLRYRQDLLDSVSFATVHILPYWEDDPVGIEQAVEHVSHIYRQTSAELTGKQVLIGETGWPSYGRQRQEAEPTLVNQARFIREFAVRATLENIPYNVIEAFDQPWKRNSEGAVGGYWGIYSADDVAKFPFKGPVAEAAAWSDAAYATMALFAAGLMLIRPRQRRVAALAASLAIGVAGGGAWIGYCRDLLMTNRSLLEWAFTGLYAGLLLVAVFALGRPLAVWCAGGQRPQSPAPVAELSPWRRNGHSRFTAAARLLGALRFLFLFSAAMICLLLVFDVHPHDFPLALFSVPAIGFALLSWITGDSQTGVEEKLLAGWLGFAGLWIAVSEHLITVQDKPWQIADGLNQHALAWSFLCLLLAGSVLRPAGFDLRAGQRQNA